MENKQPLIPTERIRRKIKHIADGRVDQETIEFLQMKIEEFFTEILTTSKEEHDKINLLRKKSGLQERRKIPITLYKKQSDLIFKCSTDRKIEEHGEMNRNTCFSEGESNE